MQALRDMAWFDGVAIVNRGLTHSASGPPSVFQEFSDHPRVRSEIRLGLLHGGEMLVIH
jgi:hypothetical protein